ncbi:MAG: signal peptidase I [Tissierellia bacterium]|nr:signal peptidase I [Tissierellia bacterium]
MSEEIKEKMTSSFWKNLWDWAKSFLLALALAFLIKTYLFEPTQVQGTSMLNTLKSGDRVIVNKIRLKFRDLARGDIVVMHYGPADEDYIKRIVGLPGDTVQLIDGYFFINGEKLEEDYITGGYTYPVKEIEWKLESGQYFLAGDNRNPGKSKDSRVFGPVDINDIKGVATLRFYPFGGSFGWLN